ncbi:hypothetical protein PGTUg99_000731 [Puccinia graminis f. sp. tritici]|uniref:Fungal-type protein kinase domain-containing protein n=2 Tax=Puccinia graminis f. sp. tritici TaxID=56615 RepID=A0A5B0RAL2_PUCGR|nr:hypothetical protein PGTUg99_000731 [Puccinia graminis f. sp. tritici]
MASAKTPRDVGLSHVAGVALTNQRSRPLTAHRTPNNNNNNNITGRMAQESGPASIHEALRSYLTSNGIETVEKFFEGGQDQIKKRLSLLGAEITIQSCLADKLDGYWMTHGTNRISRLVTVDEFKTYEPLITYILLNQAKSNQEMLQLINKEHSEPPTPQPVTSTALVRTGNISGLTNSSTKVSDFVPTLKRELNKLLYTNVQSLVEHFIDPRHIDPTHRKRTNARSRFIDQKRKKKLSNTLQGSMLKYISSFAEHLVNQTKPKNPMSRIWRTQPHTRLEGVDGTRMVDGAIMSGVNANQKNYHIRDVLVPFELKKDKQDLRKAVICLGKYVCEVFKAQPTRSFVIGVTVFETSIQIWQFDRSGAIGSEPVDFKSDKPNIEKFLDLMLCFLTCNKDLLGFDPTFIEAQDRPPVLRIQTQNDVNQELEIEPKPVFRASGICGRGTTCWKAHLSGDKSQQFLIKDSWQPEQRPKEGEMLRIVTEKKVPHVARYHHHEDVCVDGKMVDIKSHVRRGADFQNCEKLTNKEKPDDLNVQNEFINRVHRRLILKDVGKPIWTVDSPLRLLEALESCIIGHQALFAAGYLHRDISINNLMVNDQAVDPLYRSFLIDLDVAIHCSMSSGDDGHTRTGTKVFMSSSLLRGGNPHTPVDDLESFFWVLIWICIHYPKDKRNGISELASWNQQLPKNLAGIKNEYLTTPCDLTKLFTAQYRGKHLSDCVIRFAQLMSNQKIRSWKHQRLYEKILTILQEAQQKLREEETLHKEEKLREEEKKSQTGKKRKKAAENKSCVGKKRIAV